MVHLKGVTVSIIDTITDHDIPEKEDSEQTETPELATRCLETPIFPNFAIRIKAASPVQVLKSTALKVDIYQDGHFTASRIFGNEEIRTANNFSRVIKGGYERIGDDMRLKKFQFNTSYGDVQSQAEVGRDERKTIEVRVRRVKGYLAKRPPKKGRRSRLLEDKDRVVMDIATFPPRENDDGIYGSDKLEAYHVTKENPIFATFIFKYDTREALPGPGTTLPDSVKALLDRPLASLNHAECQELVLELKKELETMRKDNKLLDTKLRMARGQPLSDRDVMLLDESLSQTNVRTEHFHDEDVQFVAKRPARRCLPDDDDEVLSIDD